MTLAIAAFIRHGSYEQPQGVPSAHLPYGLTARGKAQSFSGVEQVAELVVERGLLLDRVIDCSSLRRAWETADIFARVLSEELGKPMVVECHDALAERSVGSMANLTVEEIEQIVAADPRMTPLPKGWKRDPHFRLPFIGAESLLDAGQRVKEHVSTRLPESKMAETLKLFVGHGGAFRHAAYHMGVLGLTDLAALSMHHARPVFLAREDGRWSQFEGQWKQRGHKEAVD